MMYCLRNSRKEDITYIIEKKLSDIYEYASNLPRIEINRINNYVNNQVKNNLANYQIIMLNDQIIGLFCMYKYLEGILIDEIFLEGKYRGQGIGSDIIKNIQRNNNLIYLYVYKANEKAIKLYLKLGFEVLEEMETRYKMIWQK